MHFQGERRGFHPHEQPSPAVHGRPLPACARAGRRFPAIGEFLVKFLKYFPFIFSINLLKTIPLEKVGDSLIWAFFLHM
jgi:hypothetical protein